MKTVRNLPFSISWLLMSLSLLLVFFAGAQKPVPLMFKPLPPPMSKVFYLEEIGLLGLSNGHEVQFWDAASKAYFGNVSLATKEQPDFRINHIEYLSDYGRIAIVCESYFINPSINDTIYRNYLYLYDLNTMQLDMSGSSFTEGMSALIRLKYGKRLVLPELQDAVNIFTYHYNAASGKLFTINRKGDLYIYSGARLEHKYATGASSSTLLFPSNDEKRVFVADMSKGELNGFNIASGKKVYGLPFTFIPNDGIRTNIPGARRMVSVQSNEKDNAIAILDSVNRLRILELDNDLLTSYILPGFDNMTLVDMIAMKAGNAYLITGIGESRFPPFNRIAIYSDQKTGIVNGFSGGFAPVISSSAPSFNGDKFSMVVSGMTKVEIDLTNLTERTVAQFNIQNQQLESSGTWEQGYFQLLRDQSGKLSLNVYHSDSMATTLMYTQRLPINEVGQVAGIFPRNKWFITGRSLSPDPGNYELAFFDSSGRKINSILCYYPQQTMNLTLRNQHLFSKDGRYLMVKDLLGVASPMLDSCRIRIFTTMGFNQVAEIRYTEFNFPDAYKKQTAVFSDSSNGFYFISTAAVSGNHFENRVNRFALTSSGATLVYKQSLCIDNGCMTPARIRQIRVNRDGTALSFFGSALPDSSIRFQGMQFVVITNPATGVHYGGMNIPLLPEVVNMIPFRLYLGVQFDDRIDLIQPQPGGALNHFLTIVPFLNESNLELSTVYFSPDYKTMQPYYYEKTNNDACFSFRFGNRSYRRKLFDVTFNRPDKVLENIPGFDSLYRKIYFSAVSKRSERLPEYLRRFRPDEMPVISLEGSRYKNGNHFIISIKSESKVPIKKFYITINGNRQEENITAEQDSVVQANGNIWDFDEVLTPGDNIIEVVAVNFAGLESLPVRLTQNHTRTHEKPNLHLLVLSVGEYLHPELNRLPFAVKDGRDIASLFRSLEKDTLYANIFVDTLFNEAVSTTAVNKWLRKNRSLEPVDHVVIFYSGHGFLDSNLNLRLATVSTDVKDIESSSIDYESMLKKTDRLPARNKLMLIDACHSGDFDRTAVVQSTQLPGTSAKDTSGNARGIILRKVASKDNAFELMQNLFSFSEPGSGTVVISASGGTQSAYEANRLQNGYFTYALKEAIGSNKPIADLYGRVYLNELIKYVKQRVTEMSGGKQCPNLRISNPDLNWRVR